MFPNFVPKKRNVIICTKGRLLCKIFLGSKMGPLNKRQHNVILCDSKRSSLITDFFELQFDTATLIIQSFRMIKARGCKQMFKSDRTLIGFISNIYTFILARCSLSALEPFFGHFSAARPRLVARLAPSDSPQPRGPCPRAGPPSPRPYAQR